MSQIEVVSFDYGGTLVDSEVIYSRAYVTMLREFGIHVDLEETFTRFKGVKLYEIIDIISREQGVTMVQTGTGHVYRTEVARLLNTELEDIVGTNELLVNINVPMYVVSNGPVSKMQHLLSKLNMLHYFPEKLSSGYDIQHWKPGPTLVLHAAEAVNVDAEDYILVDGPSASAQSGISAEMEVFYFRVGPHNEPTIHSKITTFTYLSQLPELWKARGWNITAQLFVLPSLTLLKLARKSK